MHANLRSYCIITSVPRQTGKRTTWKRWCKFHLVLSFTSQLLMHSLHCSAHICIITRTYSHQYMYVCATEHRVETRWKCCLLLPHGILQLQVNAAGKCQQTIIMLCIKYKWTRFHLKFYTNMLWVNVFRQTNRTDLIRTVRNFSSLSIFRISSGFRSKAGIRIKLDCKSYSIGKSNWIGQEKTRILAFIYVRCE